jgi:hypothetical protein
MTTPAARKEPILKPVDLKILKSKRLFLGECKKLENYMKTHKAGEFKSSVFKVTCLYLSASLVLERYIIGTLFLLWDRKDQSTFATTPNYSIVLLSCSKYM